MRIKEGFFIIIILFFALGLGGCGAETGEDNPEPKGIPVEVAAVVTGTVAIVDTVSGNISPAAEVPVVPKLGGKVVAVKVKVGDLVKKGDLLVQLDTSDIEAQVRQAEAGVEAARTGYVNAEAQIPNNLKIAQANYDSAKSAYDRMEYLFSEGGISEQQLEGAKTQLDVAAAQLANAESAPLQLETLKAQVKQAEAAYDVVMNQLASAFITSPIEGTVAGIHIEEGHMASPSGPIITVAQLDPVLAIFSLTESQVGKLKKGDNSITIKVNAVGNETFKGQVTEIAPVADPRTKGYQVKVRLGNAEGILKSGMTAQVELALEQLTDELIVPINSIVTKGNQQNIYLVEGEQVRECPVEILLQNDQEAAISGELEVGAKVVIAGQSLLKDGSLVRVVSREGN